MSSTLQKKFMFGVWELFVKLLSPTTGVCSVDVCIQNSCPRDVVHAAKGTCSVFHMTRVLYAFREGNNVSIDYNDKPPSKYQCNQPRRGKARCKYLGS